MTSQILSLASGTFKLSGRVVEEGRPVEGVLLTVIEGVGQGLTAGSDAAGAFALYGVAGRVRIRARKEQYRETEREVTVNSNTTDSFEIAVSRQFRNLAGTYALTLTAAPCSPGSLDPRAFPGRREDPEIYRQRRPGWPAAERKAGGRSLSSQWTWREQLLRPHRRRLRIVRDRPRCKLLLSLLVLLLRRVLRHRTAQRHE